MEARVTVYMDKATLHAALNPLFEQLENSQQSLEDFLREFFIVSQVVLADNATGLQRAEHEGLWLAVEHAHGEKCPRCWNWDVTEHEHKLCRRCQGIVK